MINCVDGDEEILDFKVRHLVNQTHFNFTSRVLVLDLHGWDPSDQLMKAVRRLIDAKVMDSYMIVDYSEEYVAKAGQRLGWDEGEDWSQIGHQGNLVYYFMLDQCPTQYLVHYDLDMVMWSAPSYSWVREGVKLLQKDERYFYATSPRVGADSEYPSENFTCENTGRGATWVAMRNFLVDIDRYSAMLDTLSSPPWNTTTKAYCSTGRRTLENLLSCSICDMRAGGVTGFQRIDLMDSTKNWVLHFPQLMKCGAGLASWVMRNMIDENIPVAVKPGFDAAFLHFWLDEGKRLLTEQKKAPLKVHERRMEEVPPICSWAMQEWDTMPELERAQWDPTLGGRAEIVLPRALAAPPE